MKPKFVSKIVDITGKSNQAYPFIDTVMNEMADQDYFPFQFLPVYNSGQQVAAIFQLMTTLEVYSEREEMEYQKEEIE